MSNLIGYAIILPKHISSICHQIRWGTVKATFTAIHPCMYISLNISNSPSPKLWTCSFLHLWVVNYYITHTNWYCTSGTDGTSGIASTIVLVYNVNILVRFYPVLFVQWPPVYQVQTNSVVWMQCPEQSNHMFWCVEAIQQHRQVGPTFFTTHWYNITNVFCHCQW